MPTKWAVQLFTEKNSREVPKEEPLKIFFHYIWNVRRMGRAAHVRRQCGSEEARGQDIVPVTVRTSPDCYYTHWQSAVPRSSHCWTADRSNYCHLRSSDISFLSDSFWLIFLSCGRDQPTESTGWSRLTSQANRGEYYLFLLRENWL